MRNRFRRMVMAMGLCVLPLVSVTAAYAEDAADQVAPSDPALAPALYEAACEARRNGDVDQAVDLIRALQAQCAGTEEALRGLLMMAEMAILGEADNGLLAESYQGMLLVRGTNWLDLREGSLGWFDGLDVNNGWALHWNYIHDRSKVRPIRGKPFVMLVKAAQQAQGSDAVWSILDQAAVDTEMGAARRKSVAGLLATIEKEAGPQLALQAAKMIAMRYSTHVMGASALSYGWELAGKIGGEEAQMSYLAPFADMEDVRGNDTSVRVRAVRRLSDHYIFRNDLVGAVAVNIRGIQKDELFSQPIDDIKAASATLAEHLQQVADKVTWDGARTTAEVLTRLAVCAEEAGKPAIGDALLQPADPVE